MMLKWVLEADRRGDRRNVYGGGFQQEESRFRCVRLPSCILLDQSVLRGAPGIYQWGPNAFVYLQMWDEFSGFGKPQTGSD